MTSPNGKPESYVPPPAEVIAGMVDHRRADAVKVMLEFTHATVRQDGRNVRIELGVPSNFLPDCTGQEWVALAAKIERLLKRELAKMWELSEPRSIVRNLATYAERQAERGQADG